MKVRMIADWNGNAVAMLECPDELNIAEEWAAWDRLWETPWASGDGPEKRMSFVEHLVWHHGCKHLDFEEFVI